MTLRHEIIFMDQEEEEEEATIPGVSQGATGNIGALTKLFSPFGETQLPMDANQAPLVLISSSGIVELTCSHLTVDND